MKIVVFGGTDFTLEMLSTLKEIGYLPASVIYIGEKYKISTSDTPMINSRYADIAGWCATNDIPSLEYKDTDHLESFLKKEKADFALLAGWYFMLPERIRTHFPKGCAGLHASLLPKYRGNAPLNWALIKGEGETGVSMFEITKGIDAGLLYAQESFLIDQKDTILDLITKSIEASKAILKRTLPAIDADILELREQNGTPSYCLQRTPEDSLIQWTDSAFSIDRLIRATAKPYSGAFTFLKGQKITVWKAEPANIEISGIPGQIAKMPDYQNPLIVTGEGCLEIIECTDDDEKCVSSLLLNNTHRKLASS